jgi:hypothetical protein
MGDFASSVDDACRVERHTRTTDGACGHTLHILNPVLNWCVEHAWGWTDNSSGMFADWNPDVACP